ncbi:DUF1289 domain-containing protein, partial [Paraburkholderia sp. Se-20369]|nr:DUF1289 domain-containing protein [Paraburkholderia sp. Se-20369]
GSAACQRSRHERHGWRAWDDDATRARLAPLDARRAHAA